MGKLLQYMTWQEAKEYFKKVKFAIIPVGSTEQHGPHLPLGTDFLIAEHLAIKTGMIMSESYRNCWSNNDIDSFCNFSGQMFCD